MEKKKSSVTHQTSHRKKMGVKSPICSPFHRPGSLWPVNQVNKDRQVFWFQTSALTETTCYCRFHSGYEIQLNYLLGHMMCWYIANCQEHKHRMHVKHQGGGAIGIQRSGSPEGTCCGPHEACGETHGNTARSGLSCIILWWLNDFNSILLV